MRIAFLEEELEQGAEEKKKWVLIVIMSHKP